MSNFDQMIPWIFVALIVGGIFLGKKGGGKGGHGGGSSSAGPS